MLDNINDKQVLFLDIETVPQQYNFKDAPDNIKYLWSKKAKFIINKDKKEEPKDVWQRAGIYAEFGKIICISVGFISENKIRLKSFYNDNEKQLLIEFKALLEKSYNKNNNFLCAHNGKEFDYPYIARRMLINNIKIPKILDLAGKKPWEVQHLDTLELWKFGDYKHYTSLELLTEIFNIPTPKDDIDGSQVSKVYYEDNDIQRIIKYCEKDVVAVVQLYLRYKNKDIISEENIISIN